MTDVGFPKELLTSERGDDGLYHARYRTATATLCGRPVTGLSVIGKPVPTCEACVTTARRFDRIDHSMPGSWKAAACA